MLQFFLNPLMLIGLAAVTLPVVAHLLNRRQYDDVSWGAMQFLRPGIRTRRRIRMQEFLLLLVRMSAVVLLALAAARPWLNSGALVGYSSGVSRDVVLVIDGSNSMTRSDGMMSLHQKAIGFASEFLKTLRPGDTVAVIDARDNPIAVMESSLQDIERVRQELARLPLPTGCANLRSACEEAVGLLSRCSNAAREVVVLTDRQRCGWTPGDDASWDRFADMLRFPAIRPVVRVVDVSHGLEPITRNVALGQIGLSRELTVPNFPLNLEVPVRNSGDKEIRVPLQILINGQRVASLDSQIVVPARSSATFQRALRLTTPGANLITVRAAIPRDALNADNESHAVVEVAAAVPVLLVESATGPPPEQNTFYAEAALKAPENQSPWVVAKKVRAADFAPEHLNGIAVVVLADVSRLAADMPDALHEFVNQGGGLIVSLGAETTPETFEKLYVSSGLMPECRLEQIQHADPDADEPISVAPYSLEAAWLTRFRERRGSGLLQASFQSWWTIKFGGEEMKADTEAEGTPPASAPPRSILGQAESSVRTLAQLSSSDPLLLQSTCGTGSVLIMTSSLNTSWNSLPKTPVYVPFLHEALFQLAASRVRRNVNFSEPLQAQVNRSLTSNGTADLTYEDPFGATLKPHLEESEQNTTVTLPHPRVPGVYELRTSPAESGTIVDRFVVNYDHSEDDPAELTRDDRIRLTAGDRLEFVDTIPALRKQMYGDESRSELWGMLMCVFLLTLVTEVWLTRRMVSQGYSMPD